MDKGKILIYIESIIIMAKRNWLSQDLENTYLPTIAKAKHPNTFKKLCKTMREDWSLRGLSSLSAHNDCMGQVRRAIKDKFGEDHSSLKFIDLSTDEYVELNQQRQQRIADRNEAVQFIDNPDAIVAKAVRLLEDSSDWADLTAALSVLTGRRSAELLSTAEFTPKTRWSVSFSGALKRRGEPVPMSFEIPTLTTSDRVCAALEKVRRELPDAQKVSPSTINVKYAPAVASACDRHFSDLVPARHGHESLYTHLFRSIYATIAAFWYCPPSVNEVEFKAAIQGHYLILDEKNPEKRRSLAASRHYSDYEIADSVIAQYKGKRKGIKLGTAGIEPIEAFKKASTRAESSDKPQKLVRTSIRVYQTDKTDLEAIFAQLQLPQKASQLDKMHALINWAKQQLQTGITREQPTSEAIEPEIQQRELAEPTLTEPIQSVTDTDTHIQESSLEQKIDRLVSVMETFVMAQLNQTQKHSDRKPSTIPKAERTASESPTPRTRAASTDSSDRLNQAINAIIAYNNAEGRLHDEKWAITINALKSWVKSQPKIMQALEARKQEISQHHQQHQIDPASHNYKHRGKHKIDQIIEIPSLDRE